MLENVIFADGIHMTQNGVYRGRLLIHAPHFIAGESTVRDKLAEEGFTDVLFFEKNNLPPDWPTDQHEDPSSSFQWTAFMQGRFTMTDRVIPVSELGSNVTLLGMWINMPDTAPQPQPRPPVPEPEPVTPPEPRLTPNVVTLPEETPKRASMAGPLLGSAAGVALIRRKGSQ
jgi:hypothetical protein